MRIRVERGEIDVEARTVPGQPGERLTPTEARLLAHLARNARRSVSQAELLEQVWGYSARATTRTVFSTVFRLRRKVETDPTRPRHLLAVPGVGYTFEPLDEPEPAAPATADPLYGREAAVAEIAHRLRPGVALTLVGPGGIGKSRLAEAVGHRLALQAVTADLYGMATAGEVAEAVARALELPAMAGAVGPRLRDALAARGPLLLVLDSAESAASALPALLPDLRGPEVRLLLTALAPIPGVDVVPVAPLDDADARMLFAHHAGCDADDVTDTELLPLDGLPLAIQIAARNRGVVPAESAAVLAFTRAPAGPARHQSLHAALSATWRALAPWERAALEALAVFEGGFTGEAAAAVIDLTGHAGAPEEPAVLQGLRRRGLLAVHTEPSLRYRLLDTVRAHAREQAGPDADATRTRHVQWCAGFAEGVPTARGAAGLGWYRALSAERANLVAALHALAAGLGSDEDCAGVLVAWLALACREGPYEEAWARAEPLLARARAATRLRGELEFQLAFLAHWRGRGAEAHDGFVVVRDVARPGSPLLRRALGGLAGACHGLGRLDEALLHTREALRLAEVDDDAHASAINLMNLGNILRDGGDLAPALDAYTRSALLATRCGDAFTEAQALLGAGTVLRATGRYDDARAAYTTAAARFRRVRSAHGESLCLSNLVNVQLSTGDHAAARAAYPAVIQRFQSLGARRSMANALSNYGQVLFDLGELDEAEEVLLRASALGAETWRFVHGISEIRLGRLRVWRGDVQAGLRHLDRAVGALDGAVKEKWAEALACRAAVHRIASDNAAADADLAAVDRARAETGLASAADLARMVAAARSDPWEAIRPPGVPASSRPRPAPR